MADFFSQSAMFIGPLSLQSWHDHCISPLSCHQRTSKIVAGVSLRVHAVRIHNVILHMWVLSPQLPSDASTVVECMTRSMEIAMEECRKRGISPPSQVLLWVPRLRFALADSGLFHSFCFIVQLPASFCVGPVFSPLVAL